VVLVASASLWMFEMKNILYSTYSYDYWRARSRTIKR
jgi:hypothetical protein